MSEFSNGHEPEPNWVDLSEGFNNENKDLETTSGDKNEIKVVLEQSEVSLEDAPEMESTIDEDELDELKLNGKAKIVVKVVADNLNIGDKLKLKSELNGEAFAVRILSMEEKGGMRIKPGLINVSYASGAYENSDTSMEVEMLGPIEKGSWKDETE